MHIQELSIHKFGIIDTQEMKNIPSGLTIIHGKNEAGKSTLVQYLRCMICGLPERFTRNSPEYKKISSFSGTMKIFAPNVYDTAINVYRSYKGEGAKGYTTSLYAEDNTALENALWNSILGASIDLEVYRNIFGISLTELSSLPNGDKIKDMLYGASLGAGTRPPSEILKEIDKKSTEIFMPRGQNALVNKLVEELLEIEKKQKLCLESMGEYTNLQADCSSLASEQEVLEKELKEYKASMYQIEKQIKAWDLSKRVHILQEEITNTLPYHGFTPSIKDEFMMQEMAIQQMEEHLEKIQKERILLEKNISAISIHNELLEQQKEVRYLEELRIQYERDIEEVQEIDTALVFIQKEIQNKLNSLGTNWTREDTKHFSINLMTEQEIDSMRKKLQENDAKIYHKKQSLEDAKQSLQAVHHRCTISKEQEARFHELPILIEIVEHAQEYSRRIEYLHAKLEDKKDSILRSMRSTSLEWEEDAMRSCTPEAKDILLLRSYIEQYSQELLTKEQQEEKAKFLTIQQENLEENLKEISDTQIDMNVDNPEEDLRHIDAIEELIYIQRTLPKNLGKSITNYSILLFVVLICISSFISFTATTATKQLVLLGFCSIISTVLTCATWIYCKKQSHTKYVQELEKLDIGTESTLHDIESAIEKTRTLLQLEDLSKKTLEERKKYLHQYQQKELQKEEKQKEYIRTREQLHISRDKIAQQENTLENIRTAWTRHLTSLSMPPLSLQYSELERFLLILKEIQLLLQEEKTIYGELYTLNEKEHGLYIQTKDTIASTVLETHTKNIYSKEVFSKLLEQYIQKTTEEKQKHNALQEDRFRIQEKIAILEHGLHYDNEDTSAITEWESWLERNGYPIFLTPETIDIFIKHIQYVQDKTIEEQELCMKQQTVKKRNAIFCEKVHSLWNILPLNIQNIYSPTDILQALQYLAKYMEEESQKAIHYKEMQSEYTKNTKIHTELQDTLRTKYAHFKSLLDKTHTKTREEFQERFESFMNYTKKKEMLELEERSLKELIYPMNVKELFTELEKKSEESLKEKLLEQEEAILLLENTKNILLEKIGSIKEKIQQAEKGDITLYSLEHAMLSTQIEEYMEQWYTLRTTRAVIEQAQKQFEEERQPRVMNIASSFMRTITENTWDRMLRSTEDIIKIRNVSGIEAMPEELSRGTQEQMYFALRLAGASVHAMSTQEALPILLDDITVNFDPERALGVAKVLKSLTQGEYEDIPKHQVFFFTCHDTVAENLVSIIPEAKLFSMEHGKIIPN